MNFQHMSTAHQIVLNQELDITEVLSISQSSLGIAINYLSGMNEKKHISIAKLDYINCLKQNISAILINVEFCNGVLQQNILISQKMAKSVRLITLKDFIIIGNMSFDNKEEIEYRRLLISANSIQYKPLVYQKALCYGWEHYKKISNIEHFRCDAFHKNYSKQFNRNRATISDLETKIVRAYESVDFVLLKEVTDKLDAVSRIMPYQFINAVNRMLLEIIKNWLIIKISIPEEFLTKTKGIINQFHLSTMNLDDDSSWRDVELALKFFN